MAINYASLVEKRESSGSSQRQLHHTKTDAEVLVKSYIRPLKIAIGEQLLTPFELYTFLLEIANLLNQRPIGRITYESHVSESDAPWKSNYGGITRSVEGHQKFPKASSSCKRTVDSFWKRWTRDVFPTLVPRKKWQCRSWRPSYSSP